jgi:hypothetical protein
MFKTLNTPSYSLQNGQGKDKRFEAQMKRVFAAFRHKPSTMLMVSVETGILRANICRYVAEWKRQGRIHEAYQGLCSVSKHRAVYYTTDPNLLTQPLTLF